MIQLSTETAERAQAALEYQLKMMGESTEPEGGFIGALVRQGKEGAETALREIVEALNPPQIVNLDELQARAHRLVNDIPALTPEEALAGLQLALDGETQLEIDFK